jgi:hypothetical protein
MQNIKPKDNIFYMEMMGRQTATLVSPRKRIFTIY